MATTTKKKKANFPPPRLEISGIKKDAATAFSVREQNERQGCGGKERRKEPFAVQIGEEMASGQQLRGKGREWMGVVVDLGGISGEQRIAKAIRKISIMGYSVRAAGDVAGHTEQI